MNGLEKQYKYDIAFSLCKQDVQFAKDLIAQLNPTINVFFYEYNQEELIAKSGPDAFGSIFKNEARIVVILSRKEWSETYYTDIERNAIIDRTSVKNEGYTFLMVIPMEKGEVPNWYPTTKIYADPRHWSIDRLASFIEFKLADEGGVIKKLSLEDRYSYLQQRIAMKKLLVQKQFLPEAILAVKTEIETIHRIVLSKIEVFKDNSLGQIKHQSWPEPLPGAYISVNGIILEIKVIAPDLTYQRIVSCQDYLFRVSFYKSSGTYTELWQEVNNLKPEKVIDYRFLFNEEQMGWAIPFIHKNGVANVDTQVLFYYKDAKEMQNSKRYFDLKDPASTNEIIDKCFQILLRLTSLTIEKYI